MPPLGHRGGRSVAAVCDCRRVPIRRVQSSYRARSRWCSYQLLEGCSGRLSCRRSWCRALNQYRHPWSVHAHDKVTIIGSKPAGVRLHRQAEDYRHFGLLNLNALHNGADDFALGRPNLDRAVATGCDLRARLSLNSEAELYFALKCLR
jgi:hypothetical protein